MGSSGRVRAAQRPAFSFTRLVIPLAAVALFSGCEGGGNKKHAAPPFVYVKGRNLYVYDVVTRKKRQLTARRDAVGDVALSPDSRWVAYTAAVRSGTDIRVVAIDGSVNRDVTPWVSFAGVHTHVDPGWLDTERLTYMDDQRAASAAVGVAHILQLKTGRRLPRRTLPPPLRGYVDEPLVVRSGVYAWSKAVLVGSSWCEHTEDLWQWRAGHVRHLTRTPQIWESPLDSEPKLPLLGAVGKFVSGHHSGGCTSDPKARVQYELRSWRGTSSSMLVRFPASSALAPRSPQAAWSPDGGQLAIISPDRRLMIRSASGAWRVVAREVSSMDW